MLLFVTAATHCNCAGLASREQHQDPAFGRGLPIVLSLGKLVDISHDDQATSALDTQNEKLIVEALDKFERCDGFRCLSHSFFLS